MVRKDVEWRKTAREKREEFEKITLLPRDYDRRDEAFLRQEQVQYLQK